MGLLDLVSDASADDSANEKPKQAVRQIDGIEITPAAITEIERLKEAENHPENFGLRLSVKGGGCSGLSYDLSFTEKKEKDHIVPAGQVEVLVDPKSYIYLKGIRLDFQSGLKGKGFVFENPNASSTCGCGESFSV